MQLQQFLNILIHSGILPIGIKLLTRSMPNRLKDADEYKMTGCRGRYKSA